MIWVSVQIFVIFEEFFWPLLCIPTRLEKRQKFQFVMTSSVMDSPDDVIKNFACKDDYALIYEVLQSDSDEKDGLKQGGSRARQRVNIDWHR